MEISILFHSFHRRLGSPLVFGEVRVAHLFSFLCCVFGGVSVAHLFSFLCCVLFVFILCLMCPMLPVSLDCPFLVAPSVFSNFYIQTRAKCGFLHQ